jgi:hypothetical protein
VSNRVRLKSVAFFIEAWISTNLGLLQRVKALIFGLDGCDRLGLVGFGKHSIFVFFESFQGVCHPESLGRCFNNIGIGHQDGIDLLGDPNPHLHMLIRAKFKLKLTDCHVRYVVVVSLRVMKVKLGVHIRMLKILEDVIGGYVEHQGIRVGIQQIYSISIKFSEGVVEEIRHIHLRIIQDCHPHIIGFIELDDFAVELHMDQILVDDRRGLEGRICEQIVRRVLVVCEFRVSMIPNVLYSFSENRVVCQFKNGRHQIISSVVSILPHFCVKAD